MLMKKNYLSAMVNRRIVIDQYGKRQSLRKSDWQRCFLRIDGDILKTWPSGGILMEDSVALNELQESIEPLDSIHLRNVHIQRLTGNGDGGSICLHFLRGMQRVLVSAMTIHMNRNNNNTLDLDESEKIIDNWVCIMHKAVKESIQQDLIYTSNWLHTTSQSQLSHLPSSASTNFNFKINTLDQEFSVDLQWPGFIKYQRCTFRIQVKSSDGCKNISKRAICFIKSDGKKVASMSQVTSFHLLSDEKIASVIIEGDGRYLQNEITAVPIVERVIVQPVMMNELRDLMIFLRDSFEIILPRPNVLTDSDMEFQPISNDTPAQSDKENEIFNSLVEAKPWSQSPWPELYKYYRSKSSKSSTPLSPIEFTLKMKKIGFCLKYGNGKIVSNQEIEDMKAAAATSEPADESDSLNKLSSLQWHHVAIKN